MRYFLCLLLPPLAVFTTGRMGAFVLSIILTICFWIPGVIHTILVTNDYYAAKRHRQLVSVMKRNR
ncbi:MAG: YqaE/Pmp3 family membrane protein [Mucilaginibacter sp.]|nr:YqaE/Pmp3 family membrane protein [Mucilaginibacter sp.]